jgi:hypothetical protein
VALNNVLLANLQLVACVAEVQLLFAYQQMEIPLVPLAFLIATAMVEFLIRRLHVSHLARLILLSKEAAWRQLLLNFIKNPLIHYYIPK